MGINNNSVRLFLEAKNNGARFANVLTLGRQELFVTKTYVKEAFHKNNIVFEQKMVDDKYADGVFSALGCSKLDAIDFSDYEGASIVHDMNKAIDPGLYQQFDFVFDGGTLEHVFNFPQAVKNCMQMVKVGGHIACITPANNQMGHGFYQFSPELHYRIFAPENGFSVIAMFIVTAGEGKEQPSWYNVADPATVKSRVTLSNSYPVDLVVLAKRTHEAGIFNVTPQQSDYAATWAVREELKTQPQPEPGALKKAFRAVVPKALRDEMYRWRTAGTRKQKTASDIGIHNPDHFTKIN